MEIGKYNVLVLRVEAKPWAINDNSGTAYSVRFLEEGRVFKAKTTEKVFNEFKDVVEKRAKLELKLSSFNEIAKLECSDMELE